ncbi:hypothetical protein NLJ89_g10262 [Agrocybe chaxingu]|uniref:Galectin domain-containing protein n=1 Tax=Agrocybe chaxingu TaxID=84603 RepID=A0A9W8JS14_9AGAR|nr:hypothetical protein NLJ89_g10262 [Agrocybe chaxingu]
MSLSQMMHSRARNDWEGLHLVDACIHMAQEFCSTASKLNNMSAAPSAHFYQIGINSTAKLVVPVTNDGIVIFRSSELNVNQNVPGGGLKVNNTSLNLLANDGSYLLHIGFRLVANTIVFNSRKPDGTWLQEKFVSSAVDHFTGPTGIPPTVIHYTKQIAGAASTLLYKVDEGEASLFSSTVAAETYTNLAALIPNLA